MFNLVFAIGIVGVIASVIPIALAFIEPSSGFLLLIGGGLAGIASSLLFIGVGKLGQMIIEIKSGLSKSENINNEQGLSVGSAVAIVVLVSVLLAGGLGFRYYQYQEGLVSSVYR